MIYKVFRILFLRRRPICEACRTNRATQVHHKSGRGRFYLVVATWMAVCFKCHDWITRNGKAAAAKGWIVRVFR